MSDARNAHKMFPVGTLFTSRDGILHQIIKADTSRDMFDTYSFADGKSMECSFYVMMINVQDRYWKVFKNGTL
jgi:hypothetical protein